MGIPNQVQKELALHRSSTFQQLPNHDKQLSNNQPRVLIIPTVDGGTPVLKKEGARVHLSELEQASKDEQMLRKHLGVMHQDEQTVNQQGIGARLHPTSLRPKSLAVPGMTSSSFSPSLLLSFLQEPQGPVMSVSPQATYLSTIIPNAVLPASVEVIEIDRGTSRTGGSTINHGGNVRTVSKSSLACGETSISPLLSRRSEGDGSQTDNSQDSLPVSTLSSCSNRSESQSSKTLISNYSPASSKSSTHSGNSSKLCVNGHDTKAEQSAEEPDLVSLSSSVSMISSPSTKSEFNVSVQGSESSVSGSLGGGEDAKNKQNSSRSLSVTKTKQPPAPPRRTNSLHSNKVRSTIKVLVEGTDLNGSACGDMENKTRSVLAKEEKTSVSEETTRRPTSTSTDAGGATQSSNSSPQKTLSEEDKFERTLSPSSGYSSQSGTPTLSPKGITPTSPEKQKQKPVKPERSASRASSAAASPSSSLTSLSSSASDPVNPDVSMCSPSLPAQEAPLTFASQEPAANSNAITLNNTVRELLNIPLPPKVKAPCPPPPETWVHNRCCFELLCGPSPNVSKISQKPVQVQDSTISQVQLKCEAEEEKQKQSTMNKSVSSESTVSQVKAETSIRPSPEGCCKETDDKAHITTEQEKLDTNVDVEKQSQSGSSILKEPDSKGVSPKKEPPPVMKKPTKVLNRVEPMSTDTSAQRQDKEYASVTTEMDLPVEETTTSTEDEVVVSAGDNGHEAGKNEITTPPMLPVQVTKICKASPPSTPPPAYQPTPPLSRKTESLSSVSAPPDELEKIQEDVNAFVEEACWPPPPPPMEGDSVFDGGDEVDFPPPPPPLVMDSEPKVVDDSMTEGPVPTDQTVNGEKAEDSGKAGEPSHEQIQELPADVPPTVMVTKSEGDMQPVSEGDTWEGNSCKPVQNVSVSDRVSPLPVEPLPPTRPEDTVSVSVTPPSSDSRRNSVKMEDHSPSGATLGAQSPNVVPAAPPLPSENLTHGVSFRRQPSATNRDTRSKELLTRHKSAPIPKEDANIPLVTPSLLQMVRLRSVNMTEDQMKVPLEDKSTTQEAPDSENSPTAIPGPLSTPQKPIRKSLSLKSPSQTVRAPSITPNAPSMRLQEAIRMKTAAMSSRDGLPSRLGVRSSIHRSTGEPGALVVRSPELCDMHRSPASTASFIFSRSSKKVVIEAAPASSPEAQANLKQSLAAELNQVSDQTRAGSVSNGVLKSDKVPPPVAKKPTQGNVLPAQINPANTNSAVEENGPAQGKPLPLPETTTRVTADTIETLF